jgi:hypothetical protein
MPVIKPAPSRHMVGVGFFLQPAGANTLVEHLETGKISDL